MAEPSCYTGGTLLKVPRVPLGQTGFTQKIDLRNPDFGSAKAQKETEQVFRGWDEIQTFRKLLEHKI